MADRLGPYLLGPNDTEENGIYTGDAVALAAELPGDCVPLIFTDPVYSMIEDYGWLARMAARVLQNDRACLAWCSNLSQYAVKEVMDRWLKFSMPLSYVVPGKTNRLMYWHTFTKRTPLMWYSRGHSLPNRWIPDTFLSTAAKSGGYKWNKNEGVIDYYMTAFSQAGEIVLDPFTGLGTVPAVAKMTARRWLAFEINPAVAQRARDRVRDTPVPLFDRNLGQLEMEMST